MNVRHLALTLALVIGVAVAVPARALADDCTESENPDACADVMPAPGGTGSTPGAPDMTVPTVDSSGDPIPFVQETTAPPPVTSLVPAAAGE